MGSESYNSLLASHFMSGLMDNKLKIEDNYVQDSTLKMLKRSGYISKGLIFQSAIVAMLSDAYVKNYYKMGSRISLMFCNLILYPLTAYIYISYKVDYKIKSLAIEHEKFLLELYPELQQKKFELIKTLSKSVENESITIKNEANLDKKNIENNKIENISIALNESNIIESDKNAFRSNNEILNEEIPKFYRTPSPRTIEESKFLYRKSKI